MFKRVLLCALVGVAVAEPAHALEPFMWGVGPRIGTMVIPGKYPSKLPRTVQDDIDNGDSNISQVRADMTVGAAAVYYGSSFFRAGIDTGLGFGSGYLDAHILLKGNYVAQAGAMDFLFGGGVGFGSTRFKGKDDSRLRVPYYPLRGEASTLIRDNTRGYQLTIYGVYNLPANHFYTDRDEVLDEDPGTGIYATVGIELALFFGDFTPPRPRRGGD